MKYIECILSWLFLIAGLLEKNDMFLIASGIFAIANNCKRSK